MKVYRGWIQIYIILSNISIITWKVTEELRELALILCMINLPRVVGVSKLGLGCINSDFVQVSQQINWETSDNLFNFLNFFFFKWE